MLLLAEACLPQGAMAARGHAARHRGAMLLLAEACQTPSRAPSRVPCLPRRRSRACRGGQACPPPLTTNCRPPDVPRRVVPAVLSFFFLCSTAAPGCECFIFNFARGCHHFDPDGRTSVQSVFCFINVGWSRGRTRAHADNHHICCTHRAPSFSPHISSPPPPPLPSAAS